MHYACSAFEREVVKKLNETDILQVSLTQATRVIRFPLSYLRFKSIQQLATFFGFRNEDHILVAK